jgi:3-isopropylmalate dehydrogenase
MKVLVLPGDGIGKEVTTQSNPLCTILSTAMMLRHSLDRPDLAARVEGAVGAALAESFRTADILQPGTIRVGTLEMGDAVVEALRSGRD